MNPIEFGQRIVQVEPNSPEAAALARDLVDEARYPAWSGVHHYLADAQPFRAEKGKALLSELREMSLLALSESSAMSSAETEVWILRTLSEELMAFRRTTGQVLKQAMARRDPLPTIPSELPYQMPKEFRVCDLAFVLLQRMMGVETSPEAFSALPFNERDKAIDELPNSKAFRYFFGSQK